MCKRVGAMYLKMHPRGWVRGDGGEHVAGTCSLPVERARLQLLLAVSAARFDPG